MARVKRGTTHNKNRKNILRRAKGFSLGRKNLIKQAKTAIMKAGAQAAVGRRLKKRDFRGLWNIKINAGARANGLSYSTLIHKLKENNIALNRKMLALLAENHPKVFEKVIKKLK